MNSASRLLPLNEVLAGMILSNDLLDTHGGLILGQGAIVTEAILLALQRRGIKALSVASEESVPPDREAEMERQRQRLAKLFRRCGDSHADNLLLRYVTQHRLKDLYE